MNKARHARAVAVLVRRLRARGHEVRVVGDGGPHCGGIDLDVDGKLVAVRVASQSRRRHVVRYGPTAYEYEKAHWVWNLHQHGQPSARGADLVALAALSAGGRHNWFFAPRGDLQGPTVQTWTSVRTGQWGGCAKRWANCWGVFEATGKRQKGAA